MNENQQNIQKQTNKTKKKTKQTDAGLQEMHPK